MTGDEKVPRYIHGCLADEKDPKARLERLNEREIHLFDQISQCLDKQDMIRGEKAQLQKKLGISIPIISKYPETLNELILELADRLFRDNIRTDAPMRWAIFTDQVGTLAGHLSHDPVENPGARPRGTSTSEAAALGHVIIQTIQYGISRGIRINEGLRLALDNIRDKDFKSTVSSETVDLKGTVACWVEKAKFDTEPGRVFVDPFCSNLKNMPIGDVLVANHPGDDFGIYIRRCGAIITNHGGMSCHAGILAREYDFTCIVGTGNATELLKTGDTVLISKTGEITVL
jgi:phosphoenolpyruvate synthase/pyruvate phosphate dikinase